MPLPGNPTLKENGSVCSIIARFPAIPYKH